MARARLCAGFFSRFRGLQFSAELKPNEGLIFACGISSRYRAAIHTLGMRFDIGVVWLDEDWRVVDKRMAKPWRFAHVPKAAAMYYLEADPAILCRVEIGDHLRIEEVAL